MSGLRRLSLGLKGLGHLAKELAAATVKPEAVPTERAIRRGTFQRRPDVSRRGPRKVEFGPSELEARAAQDVEGNLAERIVYAELSRRREVFQFQSSALGPGINYHGVGAAFLVETTQPPVALDTVSDWDQPQRQVELSDKQVRAAIAGVRYVELSDAIDIFPSPDRLSAVLDEVLGRASLPTNELAALGGTEVRNFEYYFGPGFGQTEGISGATATPWGGREQRPMTTPAFPQLDQFYAELASHAADHSVGGTDMMLTARYSDAIAIPMWNKSGLEVQRGMCVVLDSTITTIRSFSTSVIPEDHRVRGIALENIVNGSIGNVAIFGHVRDVFAIAGVTKYKYLGQSTTRGQAEGLATPTTGSFGQALTDRDSNTGTVEAFITPGGISGVTANWLLGISQLGIDTVLG